MKPMAFQTTYNILSLYTAWFISFVQLLPIILSPTNSTIYNGHSLLSFHISSPSPLISQRLYFLFCWRVPSLPSPTITHSQHFPPQFYLFVFIPSPSFRGVCCNTKHSNITTTISGNYYNSCRTLCLISLCICIFGSVSLQVDSQASFRKPSDSTRNNENKLGIIL